MKLIVFWIIGIVNISWMLSFAFSGNENVPTFMKVFLFLMAMLFLAKLIQFTFFKKTKSEVKEEKELMSRWLEGNKKECPYCNTQLVEETIKCRKCGKLLPNELLENAEQDLKKEV